ncbi:MAG: hypothetical protein AB7O44_30775 [Hyphomicrobiaceae bacterium]
MKGIIDSPSGALIAGLAIAVVLLLGWIVIAGADLFAFLVFIIRLLHVLAAMIWIGLVFFVNFVQLIVLRAADEPTRAFLHEAMVPRVAWWFRHASTAAVASGALLLLLSGYLLPSIVYGSGVYVPPERAILLWAGVIGALAMWMFVHMYIWPNMQVVLGMRPGDEDAKVQARARVVMYARLNLVLSVPVTLAMVAAAHLY